MNLHPNSDFEQRPGSGLPGGPHIPGPAADDAMMAVALREAARAFEAGELPVGAVIVTADGTIIAKAHNQREMLQDPTAHAEILALTQAASALGSWRLLDTTMFVTLEPCTMCAGALVNARVKRLVYGAPNPKAGGCGTLFDIVRDQRLNHRLEVVEGVRAAECAEILRAFFRPRRGGGALPDGSGDGYRPPAS
jgi:tRNA(adenine34) deaminase